MKYPSGGQRAVAADLHACRRGCRDYVREPALEAARLPARIDDGHVDHAGGALRRSKRVAFIGTS